MPRKHMPLLAVLLVACAMMMAACSDNDDSITNSTANGVIWTLRSTGTANFLFDVTRLDTLYAAVGADGTVLTSGDGSEWTIRETDIDVDLLGVTASDERIVAVGTNGTILTSVNGTAWTTPDTILAGVFIYDVIWTGTRFVAVGQQGAIAHSTDGLSWELIPTEVFPNLYGVVWDGTNYTAVGNGAVLSWPDTKFDAVDTIRTEDFVASLSGVLYDVGYDGDSLYVAVGQSGRIITSTDRVNWDQRAFGTNSYYRSVVWNGTTWVVVADFGQILTSLDAISWTLQYTGDADDLRGVFWDGASFMAVGFNATILTSTDGLDWTAQSSGPSNPLNGVGWADSVFVVVGDDGLVIRSADLDTWTRWPSNVVGDLMAVNGDGGLIVAVGAGGAVTTSPDGIVWTERDTPIGEQLEGVAASGSKYVAVGDQGRVISSTDAISWTDVSPVGLGVALRDVVWFSNKFVAVGNGSSIFTSPDGDTWTEQSLDTSLSVNLTGVATSGSEVVALSAAGHILHSFDGVDWGLIEALPDDTASYSFESVAYSGGQWVAVGSREIGSVIDLVTVYSEDAFTWEVGAAGITATLNAVAASDDQVFVAVGAGGDVGLILIGPVFFRRAVDRRYPDSGLPHENSHLAAMMNLVLNQRRQRRPARPLLAVHVVFYRQCFIGPLRSDLLKQR